MPTTVAIQANGAGTWRTATAVGAADGILPETIEPITLNGNKVPIESIGCNDVEGMRLVSIEANPTLKFIMRWNGAFWAFLAHWRGDDTAVNAPPFTTHDMNYQSRSTMSNITMAARIDDNNSQILEWGSLKVQQITLAPNSEGFWEMTVNCMGNSIIDDSATNGQTQLDAVTYTSKAQTMLFRKNQLRDNGQAAGALGGGDTRSVADLTLTLTRPLVTDDVTEGTAAAVNTNLEIAEPVQDGSTVITVGWNEPDFIDFAGLVSELPDDTQLKGDIIMTETIGSDAHIFTVELGSMDPMPNDANLDRQQRVPLQKNYRCIKPASTPTGQTGANPIHVELKNVENLSYETGT